MSVSGRSRAREAALQVLYQHDLLSEGLSEEERRAFLGERLAEPRLRAFAEQLVCGVLERQREIDALLQRVAQNWQLKRMAVVDRNALRLGAWEMLYSDTPPKVAIDEAIELAKRFGGKQSGAFVNGILDTLLREHAMGEGERAS